MAFWHLLRDAIVDFCEQLGRPLAPVGEAIKETLVGLPLIVPRVGLALLFLALAIWALTLSKQYIMEGAKRATLWNDLRLWAVVSMVIQIALYLTL
ncbi:hypothetical protein AMJ85_01420 [candidate division BRC1 bacterium SM23_51]|nr:MAG: hypothetical protein AMJ85_01420 [candidate division BRC1 bacterium SM23_51]